MNRFLLIVLLSLTSILVGNPGRCAKLTPTDKLLAALADGPCVKLNPTGCVTEGFVRSLIRDRVLKGTLSLRSKEDEHTTSFFVIKGAKLCRVDATIKGDPCGINILGSSYPLKTQLTLVRDLNGEVSQ